MSEVIPLPSLKDYDMRCKKHPDERMLYADRYSRFCPVCRWNYVAQKLNDLGLTSKQQIDVIELIETTFT